MTCFAYFHMESNDINLNKLDIEKFAQQQKLKIDADIIDEASSKTHWTERQIGNLLLRQAKSGDAIIVHDASQLACSTSQILEVLAKASEFGVQVHFVKYGLSLENSDALVKTTHLLEIIGRIESDFISKRTTKALARRKAAGLPLGRPKGRGNKSLKLDKHQDEIKKYLSLGISKASIAKLVGCHPQTLYDWLDRHNLESADVA